MEEYYSIYVLHVKNAKFNDIHLTQTSIDLLVFLIIIKIEFTINIINEDKISIMLISSDLLTLN